jgi:hypothetical protein
MAMKRTAFFTVASPVQPVANVNVAAVRQWRTRKNRTSKLSNVQHLLELMHEKYLREVVICQQ